MATVALAGSIFFTAPNPDAARVKLILSLVLTMAPFAVVAPFLGPAIDRSKGGRRIMLIGAAIGRALVCLYMATKLNSWQLYPCALVLLILVKAHAVAKSSLVPATIDSPDDLVAAGSRLAVLATIAALVAAGPAAGISALAGAAAGAPWVLRLAAVAYAVGAVMALRTRPAPPAVMDPPDHVDEAVRSRGVSLASTCMLTIRACSGFLTFAAAFILRRARHPSTPAWWYGLVVAAALVGGFVGNVAGPRLRRAVGEERILTAVLGMVAFAGLVAARLHNNLGLALLAMAVGAADGVGQLAFDAIVQRDGNEGARGRSFARFEATFQLGWVGAALLPVILPLSQRLAGVMVAVATGFAAISYLGARQAVLHVAHRDEPGPPSPVVAPAPPAPPRRETPGIVWADDAIVEGQARLPFEDEVGGDQDRAPQFP